MTTLTRTTLQKNMISVLFAALAVIITLTGISWAVTIQPAPAIRPPAATVIQPHLMQNRPNAVPQRMPGNVQITVRNANGAPVGGAMVSTIVNGRSLSQPTTAEGKILLPNLPTGQYTFTVVKSGYYPQTPNITVTVNPGSTASVSFFLLKYGSIRATVTDGTSALTGVLVSLPSIRPPSKVTTDASGVATVGNLVEGRYTVNLSKAGMNGVQVATTVISGQETRLPVTLTPQSTTGSLAVAVRDGVTPLPDATVTAHSYVDAKTLTAATNQQGVASFTTLPAGSCSIHAKKSGYTIVTNAAVENQEVAIVARQTTHATFQMSKQTASIDVYVRKAPYSLAVDGASVTLTGQGVAKTQVTDNQGNTRFTGLSNGNYQLIVKKDTFNDSTPYPVTLASPGIMPVNVKMYLKPKATYQVTANGSPVSGAAVLLETALAGGEPKNAVTDAQGIVVFNNLDLRVYNVSISKTGYAPYKSQLANMTADYPVVTTNVTLVKYATMEVTVSDGVTPLTGATVDTLMSAVPQTRTSNAQGKAVFNDLQPGRYTFTAKKQGYPSDSKVVDLADGELKSITLTLPIYRVISLVVNPASFRIGQRNLNLSVTLDRPVTLGSKVWLTSSDPALVALPEAGLVPYGTSASIAFSAGLPPLTTIMTAPREVTLSAASGLDRTSATAPVTTTVTVSPILLKSFGLLMQPVQPVYANVDGLDKGIGGVSIDFANGLAPIQVTLSSAEPDVLNFTGIWESTPTPYLCSIPGNQTSANFTVKAIPTAVRKTHLGEDRTVTIYADYLGQRLTAHVPVLWPRAIASLTITPPNQYGNNTATITLDRPAPANGLQVQISSPNRPAFLTLPYAVNFGGGQTTASFALAVRGGTTAASVIVTTAPYWNSSANAAVPLK